MQGAGGVGGLLWTQTPTQTFAASSDANGNIVAWINTATQAIAGRADYTPFVEPVVQTGVAKDMPFGFSSKYTDTESGVLYYGYRYLDPSTGRWISRDPIGEAGGLNLYAFVGNDPVDKWDYLGLVGQYSFLPFRIAQSAIFRLGLGHLNHFTTWDKVEFWDTWLELESDNESSIRRLLELYIKDRILKTHIRPQFGSFQVPRENLLPFARKHHIAFHAQRNMGDVLIGGPRGLTASGTISVRCNLDSGEFEFLATNIKWEWDDEFEFKNLEAMRSRTDFVPSQLLEAALARLVHGFYGLQMPYVVYWNQSIHREEPWGFQWR
jgi:RHS repeat-associated protein